MVPQSGIIPMKPPSHPPAAIFFNITDDHIRLHLGISTKNFFYNISTKELKIGFQNRKWNYFSHFQVSDQKTSFITSSPRLPRNSKFVFKTKNGIIQTGNGIISPTSRPLIKSFFFNIFFTLSKEFKIDFQNGKRNYPNRKWNYFSHFRASDQKTSFITSSPYLSRNSKLVFKTGNGIIQTQNGIISLISRPLIKKLLL